MYLTDSLPIVESLPVSLLIVEFLPVSLLIVDSSWILGLFLNILDTGSLPEHIGELSFMMGDLWARFMVRFGSLSGRGGGRWWGRVPSVLELWVLEFTVLSSIHINIRLHMLLLHPPYQDDTLEDGVFYV